MGDDGELEPLAGELLDAGHHRRRQAEARGPCHTGAMVFGPRRHLTVVADDEDW